MGAKVFARNYENPKIANISVESAESMENRNNINLSGENLSEEGSEVGSENFGEPVDINTLLDEEEFSIHRYMEISRRLTLRLEEGRYQELLEYLEGRGGQDFSESEKRLMIEIFDGFLAKIASESLALDEQRLETLAEIKKRLILFELEFSGYNVVAVKDAIRNKLQAKEPLWDLLKRPFAFVCERRLGKSIQVPVQDALNLYRDVLHEMDPGRALRTHARQVVFYQSLRPREKLKKFALRNLEKVYPLKD